MKSKYVKVWDGYQYVYINKDYIVKFYSNDSDGYGRTIDGVTIYTSVGNKIEVSRGGAQIIKELLEEN